MDPQYPYSQYPYPQPPPPPPPSVETENSVLVLILGLAGLFFLILLAPIAWWMGARDKERLEAQGYREGPMLKAGRILGLIGTVLLLIGVAIALLVGISVVALG